MKKIILPIMFIVTACVTYTPWPPKKQVSFLPCREDIFWWAVRWAESTGNPRSVYMESWGEESIGLYQLSVSDSTRYANCPSTREELFDPVKNTACKDSIAKTLRAKYPNLSYQLVLGKYWAVMRGPDWKDKMRTQSWNNFRKYAQQKGCMIL